MSLLWGSFEEPDARHLFLERLFAYKKGKKLRITVVFDAPHGVALARKKEGYKGIEVIYSKQGETADDVIIETIRKREAGLVVVSSDRALIDEAKRHGITFVTPDRMETMMEGGGDEGNGKQKSAAGKKGNPHKAPKSLRRARRTIKNI